MSSDLAISASELGKCYQIYQKPHHRLLQSLLRHRRAFYKDFWALSNVAFEVRKGETVGIIGRNGSGKSTLLQIIAGTLAPTTGTVRIDGRVAALLELGAGFNPEFTGRENVFFNCALLGMSKDQTAANFDRIAAFADIGEFMEQPVKTYSSGMYVRLAFAVSIHVDPQILIIDEALSVGDAFFQAKCTLRLKQMQELGTTILFVSHDTGAVKSLCQRALLLERGMAIAFGPADRVVEQYMARNYSEYVQSATSGAMPSRAQPTMPGNVEVLSLHENPEFQRRAAYGRVRNGKADFLEVKLLNNGLQETSVFEFGEDIVLRMVIRANCDLPVLGHGYHILNRSGVNLVYSDSAIEECNLPNVRSGEVLVLDWRFQVSLMAGDYTVECSCGIPIDLSVDLVDMCDRVPIAAKFTVTQRQPTKVYGYIHWPNKVSVYRTGQISDASALARTASA